MRYRGSRLELELQALLALPFRRVPKLLPDVSTHLPAVKPNHLDALANAPGSRSVLGTA